MLLKLAGLRSEPPRSLPSASGQQTGGERRPGAAARTARALRQVVGIDGRAVHLVVGVRAHPELGHVGLADRDHAGLPQALDENRVLRRHEVLVDRGAPCEGKADGGLQVLEGDGEAVQRPDLLSSRHTPVGLIGQGQALVVVQLRHDGVDLGIHPIDLFEVRRHHLARRELAGADETRQLASAHEAEIAGLGRRYRYCLGGSGRNGHVTGHCAQRCASASLLEEFATIWSFGRHSFFS